MGKDKHGKKSKGKKAKAVEVQPKKGKGGKKTAESKASKKTKASPAVEAAEKVWTDAEREAAVKGAHAPDALPGESEVDYQWRKAKEKEAAEVSDKLAKARVAEKRQKAKDATPDADTAEPDDEARHPHLKHLDRVGELDAIINDPSTKKKVRAEAQAELDELRAEALAVQAKRDAKVKGGKKAASFQDTRYDTAYEDAERAYVDEHDTPKKAKKTKTEPAQVTEEVQTETGREFAVGSESEHQVVAADQPEGEAAIERDHLGRPKIEYTDAAGKVKVKAYTRMTTYIKCLEDTSLLEKWKLRTALIGVVTNQAPGWPHPEGDLVGAATELVTAYDKSLRKIGKREAKGELDLGQFGLLRAEADKAHRDGLNALAEALLDLGGAHEKALKGTNLHLLTAMLDEGKIELTKADSIKELIKAGLATKADIQDLIAYDTKMRELGIKHFAIEQMVVLDDIGVAGTLDRGSLFKFPGTSRAIRCVADIKTGRVDYGIGTIGMQVVGYAKGTGYDPAQPLEQRRTDLKLSKAKGLLIHLPQGQAACKVYALDLTLAAKGFELAGQVRAWRNVGKKVADLGAELTPAVAE